ncbi:MAG: TauD/TfdA family dioxygenase [Alphaproteobacteria bacterium]
MRNSRIEVRPIAGALGAEILGVDLSLPLDDETFALIKRAHLDHLVIFFPDQKLTPSQHKDFARRFGRLNIHPHLNPSENPDADPEIFEVRREPNQRYVFGEGWHMDHTWREKPLLGGLLYAIEVPVRGGDTLFANLYLAYAALSDGMKRMLAGMRAVHEASETLYAGDPKIKLGSQDIRAFRHVHPVIRTHPETGKKLLFVNPLVIRRFDGWTEEESRPLLHYLFDHMVRPEFTCRYRWRRGDLGFWDNRCLLHNPVNDYFGQRRLMLRVAVESDDTPH